ncbi:RNA-binding protein, partial [Enterococcus faecalis]
MADVKEVILTIVRPLVSQPEAVSLQIEESTHYPEEKLTVAKEHMPRSIG